MLLKKPGETLGFVLYTTVVAGIVIGGAQFIDAEAHPWAANLQINTGNLVTFWAAYAAFLAAIWSAKVAVLNVIRQHTINTILQSRLSEIFITKGGRVTEGLAEYAKSNTPNKKKLDFVKQDDLKYLLNFYEYVAIGIKYGDLDEPVMRDTLRSVVITLCDEFDDYIADRQQKNARLFINLIWLRNKWVKSLADEQARSARESALAASEVLLRSKN